MRKFLQTLLFFIAVLSSMTISMAEENSFLDIDKHWAKQEIEMMIKDGAIGGYDDNSFKPDKEVTLAEFIKMLLIETNAKLVMQGNRWPDWYINTVSITLSGIFSTSSPFSSNSPRIFTSFSSLKVVNPYSVLPAEIFSYGSNAWLLAYSLLMVAYTFIIDPFFTV